MNKETRVRPSLEENCDGVLDLRSRLALSNTCPRPYRHLGFLGPPEQPSRRPPIAPVVGLDRFRIAVLWTSRKGMLLKPWGAAMIKKKTMGMMPRLGAIQWPLSSGAG